MSFFVLLGTLWGLNLIGELKLTDNIFSEMIYRSCIVIVLILISLTACTNNFGNKLEFGESVLFYTEDINDSDAMAIRDYLASDFEPRIKAQIAKEGSSYAFKVLGGNASGALNEQMESGLQFFAFYPLIDHLSNEVFNGSTVSVHLCNNKFETQDIISKPPYGSELKIGAEANLYYTSSISEKEAVTTRDFIEEFDKYNGVTDQFQLTKKGSTYVLKFLLPTSDLKIMDATVSTEFQGFEDLLATTTRVHLFAISKYALNTEDLEIQWCTLDLKPFNSVTYAAVYN